MGRYLKDWMTFRKRIKRDKMAGKISKIMEHSKLLGEEILKIPVFKMKWRQFGFQWCDHCSGISFKGDGEIELKHLLKFKEYLKKVLEIENEK